jgi:hypothetical protein
MMDAQGRWVPKSGTVVPAPRRTSGAPAQAELQQRLTDAGGNITRAAESYNAERAAAAARAGQPAPNPIPRNTFRNGLYEAGLAGK